jgi:hypothetical protein
MCRVSGMSCGRDPVVRPHSWPPSGPTVRLGLWHRQRREGATWRYRSRYGWDPWSSNSLFHGRDSSGLILRLGIPPYLRFPRSCIRTFLGHFHGASFGCWLRDGRSLVRILLLVAARGVTTLWGAVLSRTGPTSGMGSSSTLIMAGDRSSLIPATFPVSHSRTLWHSLSVCFKALRTALEPSRQWPLRGDKPFRRADEWSL